ncbi:MAG: M20/M25/M40 family metallo-hydrolase [Candidatus Thorarchaeota archaeon]|nr:M20/M25/M40 family metallo-hydrolase [Candidatus Thorarchaeota archaeon]
MDKWEETFLREIVELDTNSDEKKNYQACVDIIQKYCEDAGLKVEVFDSKHDGIPQPNIVATMDASAKTTVLLCTHYDVVPPGDTADWTYPPFKLTMKGSKAYGRGVTDDKGNIVASVSAAKELIKRGSSKVNWKILISPNEEIGGEWGIDYLMNGPPKIRGDFGIVVDSGPEYVSIGASGVIAGTITVHGTQGHAGYPFKFANAIHLSIPVMQSMLDYVDLRRKVESEYPAPPGSPHRTLWGRFSMTVYQAGSKTNTIPGKAEISFDCRTIPEEDVEEVAKDLEQFFKRVKEETCVEASLAFKTKHDGWGSDKDHPMIQKFHSTVKELVDPAIVISADLGGNDGHYFTSHRIPTVCFGTLRDDNNYHGLDEFMHIDDFDTVKNVLIHFAETCE